jgi:O-antigen/teichoic acid export membrane protein
MRQNIFSLTVKLFGALVSYALTGYISVFLGNERLGYFSFFLSYSLIFTLIMKSGTDIFLMKWVSKFQAAGEEGKAKYMYVRLIRYHIIAGLLITLFAICITPYVIENFFPSYSDSRFFQIIICSVFFLNLHVINYEFLRGKHKVVAYTFFSTVSVLFFTMLFLMIQDFAGIEHNRKLELAYLMASFISLLISSLQIRKILKLSVINNIPDFSILDTLKKSFPFFSNNAVFILIGALDIFILSQYVPPQVVGEYALILKFAGFVSFPLIVLGANFSPQIVSVTNRDMLQKQITRLTRWIALGSFLIFVLILVLMPHIKAYLNIANIAPASIFILVAIGYLMSAACALNEVALQMLGAEKLYQKIMFASLILNFVLNLLLIPAFKELGAAITTCITLVCWNITAVYFAKKKLNLSTSILN